MSQILLEIRAFEQSLIEIIKKNPTNYSQDSEYKKLSIALSKLKLKLEQLERRQERIK